MIISDPALYFKKPQSPKQRQYEALRRYFIEELTMKESAETAGYSFYAFQSLIRDFKTGKIVFFPSQVKGPKERRTPILIKNKVIELRKRNNSIYDIEKMMKDAGTPVSIQTIDRILREEGFSKLPRRSNRDRGKTKRSTVIPEKAKRLDFSELPNCQFDCRIAGIFYFIPYMLQLDLNKLIAQSTFPETSQLGKLNSVFSILALKLIGQERLSHIDNYNMDSGFGLFSGLNYLPKPSTISKYSYGIDKQAIDAFMQDFVRGVKSFNPEFFNGETINLDFHTIPHFGEDPPLENNWVSTRGKSMTGALTMLAHDGESKVLNYVNADIERKDAPTEILKFVEYWIEIKGVIDQTLVFDSKLTTYSILEEMDKDEIKFITLRHKGKSLIKEMLSLPKEKWKTINLKIPKRKYNKFKVYSHKRKLPRTKLEVNEIVIKDHGRENPTFVITNNFEWDVKKIVTLYAQRWRIENTIAELVKFFSLNSLSSPITIRIFFDVLLTMVGSTLYKLLTQELKGFKRCRSQTIFSKFINVPGKIVIDDEAIVVKLKKNAQTPVLKSNETFRKKWKIPWWNDRILRFEWIS